MWNQMGVYDYEAQIGTKALGQDGHKPSGSKEGGCSNVQGRDGSTVHSCSVKRKSKASDDSAVSSGTD